MVYYNPYITGLYNPLYTLNNQVPFFFIAHLALMAQKSLLTKTERMSTIVTIMPKVRTLQKPPRLRTIKSTDHQKKRPPVLQLSGKHWWQVKIRHRRQPWLICRMNFLESRVQDEPFKGLYLPCFHPICFCQNKPLYKSYPLRAKQILGYHSDEDIFKCCTTIQKGHFTRTISSYLSLFISILL